MSLIIMFLLRCDLRTCYYRYFYLVFPDVKYEVLSLGCRKGDLECVKMMINKYDCDPKGLWFTLIVCVLCEAIECQHVVNFQY